MKLRINLAYPVSLVLLFILLNLKCGKARTLSNTANVLANTKITTEAMKNNSTNKQQNATTLDSLNNQRINDTAMKTLPQQTKSSEEVQSKSSTVVTHILRQKREMDATMPYDFITMHMHCDIDLMGTPEIVDSFPNHCIWVTNNRYQHEGFYRVYKMYQLEAHFFGQYWQRLKRYENDERYFDYA